MKKIFCCLLLIWAAACKEKYISPYRPPVTGYLVIEGVVNSGPGNTTIKLSRTTQLVNIDTIAFESGALVKLEGDDNSLYIFSETIAGSYTANSLNLNNSAKYRLHINTVDGREYVSDYAVVNNNPPIDSISWLRDSTGGVQIYVNTHDPQNNTRYYQWEYSETWEFLSSSLTSLKYVVTHSPTGDEYSLVKRDSSDPKVFRCWQSELSQNIIIGSSAKLSEDLIYQQPITEIPSASWKLSEQYSIDVKQYGLNSDAYKFLDEIKKTTEQTGSIFDAQPSELTSNYHCVTNPSENVIGYITICPVQEKRIFISNSQISNWGYNSGCFQVILDNNPDTLKKYAPVYLPSIPIRTGPGGSIITFSAAPPVCVDCTLRGTNTKPDFWP